MITHLNLNNREDTDHHLASIPTCHELRKDILFLRTWNYICMIVFCFLFSRQEIHAGNYTNDFLGISVSPAISAQGNAGLAAPLDGFSLFYNPALIHCVQRGVSFSHTEFFSGLYSFDALACKLPFKTENIGLMVVRAGIDHIPDTRQALVDLNQNGILDPGEYLDETKISYFSNQDYAVFFCYGILFRQIKLGANLKWIYRHLSDSRGFGLGIDLGAYYERIHWSLGLNLRDITTTVVSWDTGETEFTYPQIAIGGQWKMKNWISWIYPALYGDLVFFTSNLDRAALVSTSVVDFGFTWGLSLRYRNILTFRLGFDSSQSDNRIRLNDYVNKTITIGMGIHWNQYGINYAFLRHQYLNNTHRIALDYSF